MRVAAWAMVTAFGVMWGGGMVVGYAESQRIQTSVAGLTIYVHNFSDLDDATVEAAAREAENVFRRAAVPMRVVNDPMIMSGGERRPAKNFAHTAADLVANILTKEMAAVLPVRQEVLGVAPGAEIKGRSMAYVFAHRVQELARMQRDTIYNGAPAWIASESKILGYAIAHEIGHLLLNMAEHSSAGIMRANWDQKDLQFIATGKFLFSVKEMNLLRVEAARRLSLAMISTGESALPASANSQQ